MIGLSLEGGGVKGAYQAGAYMAFKKCHIKFDGIVGTSIGSLNGALIASGDGDKMVEMWKNIDIAKALLFNPEKIAKLEAKDPFVFASILSDIIKNKGISTDGLIEIIENNVNEEKLKKSKKDYGLCTVRVKGMKPLYLLKEDIPKNTLGKFIMNSCYLPVFKMEKSVDNSYYLDGGFYDNSPYNMLIKKGYNKIYNVGMHGIGFSRKPIKGVEIINIKPIRSVGGIITFNKNVIEETIEMGYFDTLRVLKKYDGYNYVFKRKKLKFYQRIIKKINRKEIKRVENFFFSKNEKETIINAVEYIMRKEKINYYKIYNIKKIIRMIKKKYKKDHFVYNFVRNLNVL